jgi:hypothetical protein
MAIFLEFNMGTKDGIRKGLEAARAGLMAEDLLNEWQKHGYQPSIVSGHFDVDDGSGGTYRYTLTIDRVWLGLPEPPNAGAGEQNEPY